MRAAAEQTWRSGEVARRLGIAESTLRSWHRRYGIGPSDGEPGQHRRYTEADIAQLQRMLELITTGVLPSDAAWTVQASEHGAEPDDRDVAGLVAAARTADSERCRILLNTLLARRGIAGTWDTVCRPALITVDADQRDDPDCIDAEHALSWAIQGALQSVRHPRVAPGISPVLLACVDAEAHTLPLAVLAAALAGHRVPVRMLGAATPTRGLVRAARYARPAALVLWAQRPDTASPGVIQALTPCPGRLYTAGPGWPATGLPRAGHLASLGQAVTALVSATSGKSGLGAE